MTTPTIDRALGELYGEPLPRTDLVRLKGDASTRSYFRAHVRGAPADRPATLIVMRLPDDAFGSDEGGAQPDTARLPFLEVAELLSSRGVRVPEVYAEDLANGVLLLEDLGDVTLHKELMRVPTADWPGLYAQAVDLLADLHDRCRELPDDSVVAKRRFDRELLTWELDHFREWGLEALFGKLAGEERAALDDCFREIVDRIERMPYQFVHRDYQSKNLMVDPGGALALIDFQDALLGPRAYDLVALLCDSYVSLDRDLQETLIERYAALRRIEPTELRAEFWCVALHRKLKDAGRFVYIDRVRGNPDFLQWFPQSLLYVGRATRATGLSALDAILRRSIPGFPDAVGKPTSSME